MDVSIVIPCYNEAANIPKLQAELWPVVANLAEGRSVEVIFVDDGSSDGTHHALVEAFGDSTEPTILVRIEQHQVNRGLGAALRTGFSAARGELVVTTDSDGTYEFSETPDLLSRLTRGADIVTASPYHPAGRVAGVPGYRLLCSRGCSAIYRLLTDGRLHTYTSLFRAYRREVIEAVPFNSDGFLAGTELMVKAMFLGYQVVEYPAVLHQREFGESKARLLRTILAHLRFQAGVLGLRLGLKPIEERPEATEEPKYV